MSDEMRNRYLFGCVLASLGVLALLRVFAGAPTGADGAPTGADNVVPVTGTGGADMARSTASFSIEGDTAARISPGVSVPLDLEFTNAYIGPMLVTDLEVTVREVSAPRADGLHPCSVGDFTVGQVSRNLSITIGAGATRTLSSLDLPRATWPQVGMLNSSVNQDGCKGASVTLDFTASATLDS